MKTDRFEVTLLIRGDMLVAMGNARRFFLDATKALADKTDVIVEGRITLFEDSFSRWGSEYCRNVISIVGVRNPRYQTCTPAEWRQGVEFVVASVACRLDTEPAMIEFSEVDIVFVDGSKPPPFVGGPFPSAGRE